MALRWSSFLEFHELINGVGPIYEDLQVPKITTHFIQWFHLISSKVLNIFPELLLMVGKTKQIWVTAAVLLLLLWLFTQVFQMVMNCVKDGVFPTEHIEEVPGNVFDMAKVAYKPGLSEKLRKLLDKKKLDINAVQMNSDCKLTLFLCACLSGERKLLEYMILKGADVKVKTPWKDGPLHLAAFACTQSESTDFRAIAVLVQAGCDINGRNWCGSTPLSIAASSGKETLIRYLLFMGADPSMRNDEGIYPLDFAINAGHTGAAKLLAIDVPNPFVWDFLEPHTPPRIKLGLQTPSKRHLVDSSFTRRRRMDFTC